MATDLDLGEYDNEEELEFPPPERKLVTQSYDLSMQVLLDQWTSETLIVPEIQRDYVWDNGKASRLIESLLLNIPIPVLYFAETPAAKWEIIDGQQRIVSVVRFLQNEFALSGIQVLSDFARMRFRQLPEREQRYLERRTMRAVVISPDSHPSMTFEVFARLNTGSVALNTQEIRNALYRGPFNRMLRRLVTNADLREAIATRHPRNRMVDEELLLRFFALRDRIRSYRPPLSRFLNEFMGANQNAGDNVLSRFESDFAETIATVNAVLGGGAFRITDEEGTVLERNVNRALFDAQMLAFSWVRGGDPVSSRQALLTEFAELYDDSEFLDSISRATGDRNRLLLRVRRVVEACRSAGLELRAPSLHLLARDAVPRARGPFKRLSPKWTTFNALTLPRQAVY